MTTERTGVAIAGCGNIAGPYAKCLDDYPEIDLLGFADLDVTRAEGLATTYSAKAYRSVDELLADDRVDIVVNLTIHHAHHAVTTRCLEAGKHVHSEKPLALTAEEAQDLVALAERKGLRLGASPITFMGEAQQTVWKLLREGRIATPRLVYAEMNHGRIETWHPNPAPFYEVGPFADVGVYPLTILTTFFGPARKVQAYGRVLYPNRKTKDGTPFQVGTPDNVIALIEFADGPVLRLTANFYVADSLQKGIEFHGDGGSIFLGSASAFDAEVSAGDFGQGLKSVSLLRRPFKGVEWGCGIRDMAAAIREDRPHRATGEQAAHVVDIMVSALRSAESGRPVAITSDFVPPAPMEWANAS